LRRTVSPAYTGAMTPFRLAAVLAVLAATPVHARALLLASDPQANAAVAAGPTDITLRFSGHIDPVRSRLVLSGPHGAQPRLRRAETRAPGVLAARADLAPGAYVLHWKVLADDGYFSSGDLRFTVALEPGN
jgi:copper resistance protein C